MWLPSWPNRFGAGRHHARAGGVGAGSRGGRRARRLSVERLEDRLAPSAGALDPIFGTGGMVITDFDGSRDGGSAMALQTDGKIVVVGDTDSGGGGINFALARYLPNGTPDPSFSFDGKVATDFAGGEDHAFGVAIQPADGKVVVVGKVTVSGLFHFGLARYNSDGKLDTSFGPNGTGKLTTDFGGGFDEAKSVAVQADGKIVVVGRALVGGSLDRFLDFALARYNSNGKPDNSFGPNGDGKVTTDIAGNTDSANDVVIQADGKILVAGANRVGNFDNFALARYNSNGSPDSDFDADGKLTTPFNDVGSDISSGDATGVALQADGKIVAAGFAINGLANDFALARYNPDGGLDATFGTGGQVTTNLGGSDFEAFSVAIQPAGGRIVAAGFARDRVTGAKTFALARYNPNGTLDRSFDGDGKVTTDLGSGEEAHGVAIQADGKIVAAGIASGDFALARYEGVAPEIAVSLGNADLAGNAAVSYGSTLVGTPVTKTFTISNLGNLNLTVSSITVPAGYRLNLITTSFTVAPGAQTSVNVVLTATTAGNFSGQISISNNDSDENPFLINVTGTVVTPAPEIQVLTGTTDIPDNSGVVNFGTHLLGSTVTRSFTVQNIGTANLTLGPGFTVSAPFFLTSAVASTTLGPGASTTFTVAFNTNILGTFTSQISFVTNDSDENPFNFTVTGAVALAIALPMIRGESLTRHVDEGGVATLRGHLVDSDPLDELFLRVDWADGTPPETHAVGRAPFALQHRYLDDAPSGTAADEYQVHFTWFDSGGGSNSETLPVTVANVAPRVSVGLPAHLQTNEALTRVGTFTDPGLDSWYATVDYGDGRGPQWLALGADNSFTLSHVYTRPGDYQVRVRVFDDDGGVGTATLPVTVRNATPQLFVGGTDVVRAGEVMRHTGSFTDPDSNTWRATVDYGDGDGPQPLAVLSGQKLSFEHRYAKPGRYRVTVTVLDDDGALATDSFLVIVL